MLTPEQKAELTLQLKLLAGLKEHKLRELSALGITRKKIRFLQQEGLISMTTVNGIAKYRIS